LSPVIVDVRVLGVRISPLRLMDGNVFAEILFDQVHVPVACRIGGENQAWSMMAGALADERHVHFGPVRALADLETGSDFFKRNALDNDPVVRDHLVDSTLDALESHAHSLRVLATVVKAREPVGEVAASKLAHVRAIQSMARAAMKLGGIAAALDPQMNLLWRQTTTKSIGGGTTEIMQSSVARQRLGLGGTL
jgi:alkylation response protein AidB-like acyl-CoA dehydrogenase